MKLSELQPRVVRLLEAPEQPRPKRGYEYVKRWRERNREARNRSRRAATAANRKPKPCAHCGNEFQPTHALVKYCAEACRSRAEWKRWRADYSRRQRATNQSPSSASEVGGK